MILFIARLLHFTPVTLFVPGKLYLCVKFLRFEFVIRRLKLPLRFIATRWNLVKIRQHVVRYSSLIPEI